ncbi:MAG TPA: DUF169 domain-containing protein [Syntrophales bacterium]|nr:DUF169 domain-containing protein [Syntrophales bacterium]HOX94251.1 DUF169 domain-containing protein [Syntrophales bacterium]HPI58282.1 DUF169 domain-containing protein [Syntrophales bacterium]HPN26100.1 DUF169 domain-containing protein [Syntrophales bacterium]HQM30476.1 DUF169 domain-containing protein [Syntrophales bacterium]
MKEQNARSAVVKEIERYMRLRTSPVGFKFLASKEDLGKVEKVRRPKKYSTACQLITMARTFGWTFGVTGPELMPICSIVLGFMDSPPRVKDGTLRSVAWCRTKEDAKKFEEAIPRIPLGKYEALLMGPATTGLFEPDFVLFYANPAQIIVMINALQFEDYERLTFYCVGESSCSDSIVQCHLSGKPAVGIPCFGERRFGTAQDDEMVMAVPGPMLEKLCRNLMELSKRGVRYPITFYGPQVDPISGIPPVNLEYLEVKDQPDTKKK